MKAVADLSDLLSLPERQNRRKSVKSDIFQRWDLGTNVHSSEEWILHVLGYPNCLFWASQSKTGFSHDPYLQYSDAIKNHTGNILQGRRLIELSRIPVLVIHAVPFNHLVITELVSQEPPAAERKSFKKIRKYLRSLTEIFFIQYILIIFPSLNSSNMAPSYPPNCMFFSLSLK